jgi:predicted GH43/DUF377 family glycosyl hydrolase
MKTLEKPTVEPLNAGWQWGPFVKCDEANPVIEPLADSEFDCPLSRKKVRWESFHTFNPAAVVREGKIYLLYRAEDDSGLGLGRHCSRLGLAVSEDGLSFARRSTPVFYPADDEQREQEWPGGVEDPRLVETEDGTYVMTYTQYNRDRTRLGIATSKDLVSWQKHGFAFDDAAFEQINFDGGKFPGNKAGAIITRREGDRLIATKVNGKYGMYWGEGRVYFATSDDLIHWEPLLDSNGKLQLILGPRADKFDSDLAEPGPPAIITEQGILLIYNGRNAEVDNDPSLPVGTYSAGQALFATGDPVRLVDRADSPFLKPERPYEITGQYTEGTVFVEGLVHFDNRWFLYYGTADSQVAVATYTLGTSWGIPVTTS